LKKDARELIVELSMSTDFNQLLESKTKKLETTSADEYAGMSLHDFFPFFWDIYRSPYLQARADSDKPLSKAYIRNQNYGVTPNGTIPQKRHPFIGRTSSDDRSRGSRHHAASSSIERWAEK